MKVPRLALIVMGLLMPPVVSSADILYQRSASGHHLVRRFDPKLAVEYGKLINLAYAMNNLAISKHEYTPPYGDLPSQYNFVAWVRMNDFTPRGKIRQAFYGIIVQLKSNPTSFIIALRGTQETNWVEWFDDFMSVFPTKMPGFPGEVGDGFGKDFRVHGGDRRRRSTDNEIWSRFHQGASWRHYR